MRLDHQQELSISHFPWVILTILASLWRDGYEPNPSKSSRATSERDAATTIWQQRAKPCQKESRRKASAAFQGGETEAARIFISKTLLILTSRAASRTKVFLANFFQEQVRKAS